MNTEQRIYRLEKMVQCLRCNNNGGGGTSIHNNLQGLQGGQPGQYYHLTQEEYDNLGDFDQENTNVVHTFTLDDIGADGTEDEETLNQLIVDYINSQNITIGETENHYFILVDGNDGGGDGAPSEQFILVTKTELDTHIANSTLKPGVLYGITETERWMLLGDSTDTLYLRAISTNQLETKGTGKFFVPKYDQNVDGYGIWQGEVYEAFPTTVPEPTYTIGDKVIWGGRLWNNVSGNLGTKVDIYTLSADWEVIPFNETDYNVRFNKIEYDYQNDMVIYRKDDNGNEISTSYEDWYVKENGFDGNPLNVSLWNSLKIYQWGNEYRFDTAKGCGFNTVTNSILECLNTYGNINSNTLENNGNINSNTLNNGHISYNTLENYGHISYNTLNNGYINFNTLENNGSIISNTLNNGYINSNTLENNGNINSNTLENYGNINSNILNSGNINFNTLENNGYIYSNTLNNGNINFNTLENNGNIYSNTLENNGSIYSNTLENNGNINFNTLENYGQIYSNILNSGNINFNTLENNGSINSNTLENNGYISYNTLENNGNISYNTLNNGSINSNTLNNGQIRLGLTNTINNKHIKYLTINNGDIGGLTGIDLSSATLVYADFTREVFKDSTGTTKIRYVDGSDATIIANLTA